ncbi:MAG: glycosyltransferase family 4 protein [Vicinamibacterales bacterium]
MSVRSERLERRMRIAVVAPVARPVPPSREGSIETVTSLLTEGLVKRGHQVTLFATGQSVTSAKLHATFAEGYHTDTSLWPWELCELFNLSAAVERATDFDVIHYQAEYAPMLLAFSRLSVTPVLQTLHHAPAPSEVEIWSRYPEVPFVAVSHTQARLLSGLNVVSTIHHAVDVETFAFREVPGDYLLFLGRFLERKGVLEAIEVARRSGMRLVLAGPANGYYGDVVQPLVDGDSVVFVGEVDRHEAAALLGGARALVYPVREAEPFGLVIAEAISCGTPVAALDIGAVGELVDDGVTGGVFPTVDALVEGLPRVLGLDRHLVRTRAVERFSATRMVDEYVSVYRRLAAAPAARRRA